MASKKTVAFNELLDSNDSTIYDLETHSPGPEGSLPLTPEMLLNLPSGDVFAWSHNAGMGWAPGELNRREFLILSTQGGIRAPDGSPIALGYHTGHWEVGLSATEYFAESGFAYAVNIHPVICPSGPYVWNHEPILDALRHLGLEGERIGSGYDSKTRPAREAVEAKVQAGFSEAVVSMEGLEHQLIVDANSERMTFAMPWGDQAESCMKEMVCEDWRSVKEPPPFGFYRFDHCDVAPKEVRIRLAIDTALAAYESPSKFEMEDYKYGLNAYSLWVDALKVDSEDTHGQWWNCMVWSECRHFASEYFRELSIDSNDQTDELANKFKQSSDLLMKASAHELPNDQKSALIQQLEANETRIPPLLREIRSKLT